MTAQFLKSGKTYRVSSKEAMDLHDKLPAGNYTVQKDQMTGQLYLEQIEDFTAVKKMYGNTAKHTHRIINTFKDRSSSTGVMLNGEKGSGKTLLSKNISIELAKEGVPTIVINAPWAGDKFNQLLQSIEQPCIVLFDEFEKTYDRETQESILTLLDGVFNSKKLYILTCNDKWRVDQHMRNRPGRIFYMMDFIGLDVDFIREYCEDNLNNKSHIQKICDISTLFKAFNFDMLQALVQEMNRYNETPQEALTMLNAKPEYGGEQRFTQRIFKNEVEVFETSGRRAGKATAYYEGNPLSPDGFTIEYWDTTNNPKLAKVSLSTNEEPALDDIFDDEDDDGSTWAYVKVGPEHLVKVDSTNGVFVFDHTETGVKIVLQKVKEKAFNIDAF